MQANLLHGKMNVWSGEREVLKSTNNTTVESGISGRLSISGRELRLGLGRSSSRFAIFHASTIQEIKSILSLMKKKSGGITSHINAEEEVQCAQVLQPKLRTEATNDVTK